MALRKCPVCGKASFEKVAESGEWWWMCHECDYEEEINEEEEAILDFDPNALCEEGEDYLEDDEELGYSWGFDGDLDEEE